MDDAALIQALKDTGVVSIEKEPDNPENSTVFVTKEGRNEIINLFHEGEEKKELKPLIKKFEANLSSK